MDRAELLREAGLFKAAFNYGRRKVRGAGGGAWHYAATTKRDTKAMLKYHRVSRNMSAKNALLHQLSGGKDKGVKLRGVFRTAHGKAATGRLDALATRTAKIAKTAAGRRDAAVKRNAVRAGAVVLGAGAAIGAAKLYRWKKRQAQERPQFSSYDVYPKLGHAATRQQVYNRPVYYDDRDVGSGPPRHEDINMTREELIEMTMGQLVQKGKGKIRKYRSGQAQKLKKYEKRMARDPLAKARHGKIMGYKQGIKIGLGAIAGAKVGSNVGKAIGRIAPLHKNQTAMLKFAKKYPELSTTQRMWPSHRKALDARTNRTNTGGSVGHMVGMVAGTVGGAYLAHRMTPRDHKQTMMYTRGRPHHKVGSLVHGSDMVTKNVKKRRAKKLREELISGVIEALSPE